MKALVRFCLLFSLSLLFYVSFADSQPSTKNNHHIYLLIGQSNMAGRAPIVEAENKPLERGFVLNSEGKWEPAKNPLNQYSTIRKNLKMQKSNLGYSFASSMLEGQQDITVGLVVNAKGGSKIESWEPGTRFYKEALSRTKIALKSGVLKGVLWHQGESNSSQPEGYVNKLEKLITQLRKDFDQPDLPFVAGQVFYDAVKKAGTKKVNAEILKLPKVVKRTEVVLSNGLSTYDNTHFDSKSIVELGHRYAVKIKAIK